MTNLDKVMKWSSLEQAPHTVQWPCWRCTWRRQESLQAVKVSYFGELQAERYKHLDQQATSRFSELLKHKLKDLGFPPVEFSPHSLQSGGATAAAGAGILNRNFKHHGSWKSEKAKDGYVQDTLENQLSVTKNLGL